MSHHIKKILELLGEDTGREGLLKTPSRYSRAMRFLTAGYKADIKKTVGDAIFHEKTSGLVVVRDLDVFSLCEHHLLPFYGKAHVAYLPDGKIIGLSKIPRITDIFARRLQVQERLTSQVADTLMELLNPHGVAVIIEAFHLCMIMRGVEKQSSYTMTSSMLGAFKEDPKLRDEFLNLLRTPPRHQHGQSFFNSTSPVSCELIP
ncbi:MAG: GTP cyclohydrolase I FolE [Bdellovibrionota bacterium]